MKKKLLILLFITTSLFTLHSDDIENTVSISVINTQELTHLETLSRQTKKYRELNLVDPYETFSKEIEENYKILASKKIPSINFYVYENKEFKTLLQLAARCNLTQETLATLNSIENPSENIIGKTLLIPTCPGIFLKNSTKKNNLEILLFENYQFETLTKKRIWYNIDDVEFIFLPNQKLSPTERAYFLDCELQLPIEKDSFWISSDFGKRENPFSGELKNHKGIDLAAKEGTPVYAIKDGHVAVKVKEDNVFGNYLILSHDKGKMTSVYAHLSKMSVEQNDIIKKGALIGFVGKTGMATGSHLHFEIRTGGKAQDPQKMLNF